MNTLQSAPDGRTPLYRIAKAAARNAYLRLKRLGMTGEAGRFRTMLDCYADTGEALLIWRHDRLPGIPMRRIVRELGAVLLQDALTAELNSRK